MSAASDPSGGLPALPDTAVQRLPLLSLLPAFLPQAAQPVFLAWIGLLGECEAALFESSEPRVRSLRCAWWAEELAALAAAAPRHPLGRGLISPRLPWAGLAQAVAEAIDDDAAAIDAAAAAATLLPLAMAVARIDAALVGAATPDEAAAARFLRHWQVLALGQGEPRPAAGSAGIPLAFWARHGRRPVAGAAAPEVLRDWAGHLLGAMAPDCPGETLLARLLAEDDRRRLQALAAGRRPAVLPVWRRPFAFWRCTRDAVLHYRISPSAET